MIGSRLNIVLMPICARSPIGFEYMAMNIVGASTRLREPLPAADTSRRPPMFV